jgi:hypothetical protein
MGLCEARKQNAPFLPKKNAIFLGNVSSSTLRYSQHTQNIIHRKTKTLAVNN